MTPDDIREIAYDLERRCGMKADRAVRCLHSLAAFVEEHGQPICQTHELPCDDDGNCSACRE